MTNGTQNNSAKQENTDLPPKESIDPDATGSNQVASDHYEIKIRDHLETYWFEWFKGWSITNLENGEVLLSSSKIDQSALHGALNKISNLNLTLLSVTRASQNKESVAAFHQLTLFGVFKKNQQESGEKMNTLSIILSALTILMVLSQLICGLWLKFQGTDASSVAFHMRFGIGTVAMTLITVSVMLFSLLKN